ncbi:MAG: hypothetical protein LBH73_07855 [Spirochaetaceae bacterium]|jgi:hypothetical protein|nr:hypothetical protein [Spirochaetaceae bacterium]
MAIKFYFGVIVGFFGIRNIIIAIRRFLDDDGDAGVLALIAAILFLSSAVISIKSALFPHEEKNSKKEKSEDKMSINDLIKNDLISEEVIKEAEKIRHLYGKDEYINFLKNKTKELNISFDDEGKL